MAANLDAFRNAFGNTATALGNARLDLGTNGPHFVRLLRPLDDANWEVVDEVAFLRTSPWPLAANGGGASLQLIDATQDNRRVANWSAVLGATTNAPRNVLTFTNAWRYKQDGPAPADWRQPNFDDTAWPSGRGLLHVEDAPLPAPKNTALVRTEGRMTYYFRTTFDFTGNPDGAALVLQTLVDDGFVLYLNGREIHRLGLDPAAPVTDVTPANRTVSDALVEGPFTLPVTNLVSGLNVLAAEVHQVNTTSSDIVWGATVDVLEVKREAFTPGYANSVRAALPRFPEVWISELLPHNLTGPTDNAGEHEPWIELHNAGTTPLDLAGWSLTDDLTAPRRWSLPNPAPLAPGEYRLIWADAETAEHTPTDWHASFRLPSPRGSVALVRDLNGSTAIIDFVEYNLSPPDLSFGFASALAPLDRAPLAVPTPAAANLGATPNRAPVIANVLPQRAEVGSVFVLDLRATDPDPGQHLTYGWISAPPGLGIDTSTGRITWSPTADQVGTYTATVRVQDDGQPPLDARAELEFTVVARPLETLTITRWERLSPTELQLTWSTVPGHRYAIQRALTPLDRDWTQLGNPVTASGTNLGVTLVLEPGPGERFFRIVRTD